MTDVNPYQVGSNAPVSGWAVTTQSETLERDDAGNVTRGYRVVFRTAKGATGSVFLPLAQYNPSNVRAAIAAMAHQLDQVQGMSG